MAVPSGFCPGTLVPRGLHVADDAMLPAFGPGEGHRPSTGQRAGAGRPSIGAAAGDPVVGAVTPRGRQPASPHAATPTRAAYREVPPYFIEPSPPEGATRSARPAVGVPLAFLCETPFETSHAFVCETPFETSDFGRVTGGGNVTDGGLTAACTLRRMPASPREVGGAAGGNHRSPFHAWGV